MVKILLIGKSGRLDCIAEALFKSPRPKKLYAISEVKNPGLLEKTEGSVEKGSTENRDFISRYAKKIQPDFAIIGPEEPLAVGVADMLTEQLGIPCVGPVKSLARLEWSKSFTRELISKHNIPGNPDFRVFKSLEGVKEYAHELGEFVVKPDGLTSGKGVKVFGEHLHSIEEALQYCESILKTEQESFLIEEKLDGEEFSFQSFCDGEHVVDSVAVQDHKRAFDGDSGPNTGGMGSYSCEDHSLPFLSEQHIQQASQINLAVAQALKSEFGPKFKGILYGGFILTRKGLKLLEYNARFGDPEVMNVLPLLKTDFIDVCEAMINGSLDELSVEFEKKATVCKYAVPKGYPDNPKENWEIDLKLVPKATANLKVYYGAVDKKNINCYLTTGSRAIAFVGIGNNLQEAEQIAEKAVTSINIPLLYHRKDIGTHMLIQKRIDHINQVMGIQSVFAA